MLWLPYFLRILWQACYNYYFYYSSSF
jgi:hypothetical protein